jgi:hypothetical protein
MDLDPTTAISSPIDSLEGPKPPKKAQRQLRFKTAMDAYNAYKEAREGDRGSAINRLSVQMQLDGVPPYSPKELARRGLSTITNVNFGFMEDALEAATAPYENMIESARDICYIPTTYGRDDQERKDLSKGIEEEYTALTLNDDNFDNDFSELVRQFTLNGIVVPYFESEKGITWQTTEMGNFLINRDIRARESEVDVAFAVREFLPYQIHNMITKPGAEEAGWNVQAAWEAIKAATPNVDYSDDWEKVQIEWKNNDFGYSYAGKAKTCRLVHIWGRDRDGRISHMIIDANESKSEFIFKYPGRFEHLSHCFTIITSNVGSNGKYHGIRGIGYKIYALVKEMNEVWSSFMDAIRMNSKIIIKPTDDAAMKNMQLVEFGHWLVLPPKADAIFPEFPDYSRNILPGMQLMEQKLQSKTKGYSGDSLQSQFEQTRAEVMARLDQVAQLSTSRSNIFYKGWTKLQRERVRRLCKVTNHKGHPDYDKIQEFFEACKKRGISKEAIRAVDIRKVYAIKAMGNGSPAAQSAIFDRLDKLRGELDAEGRHNLTRDQIRVIAGRDAANEYKPAIPGRRPPIDKKMAILENGQMSQGLPVSVEPNEMHDVHVIEHLLGDSGLRTDVDAYEAGQVGLEAIPAMRIKYLHTEEHMKQIPDDMPDGTPNMEKSQFNKALQELDETIYNGEKKLEAEQKKRQEEEAAQAQEMMQRGAEISESEGRSIDQSQAALGELQMTLDGQAAKNQQELAHKEAMFQQQMSHKQAEADVQIATQVAREVAKVQTEKAKPKPAPTQ